MNIKQVYLNYTDILLSKGYIEFLCCDTGYVNIYLSRVHLSRVLLIQMLKVVLSTVFYPIYRGYVNTGFLVFTKTFMEHSGLKAKETQ